jgi:hypothetical protein
MSIALVPILMAHRGDRPKHAVSNIVVVHAPRKIAAPRDRDVHASSSQ